MWFKKIISIYLSLFSLFLSAQTGLVTSKTMVVSAREEASQIGVTIMKKGGNAFDAMVFETPYRRGQAAELAFAEIERHQGLQFDPEIVTAFLQLRDKVAEAMLAFPVR